MLKKFGNFLSLYQENSIVVKMISLFYLKKIIGGLSFKILFLIGLIDNLDHLKTIISLEKDGMNLLKVLKREIVVVNQKNQNLNQN